MSLGSKWLWAVIFALVLSPTVAAAERGALRIEIGFGGGASSLPPPPELMAEQPEPVEQPEFVAEPLELLLTTPIGGELAIRYFLGHDLALGLVFRGEPSRRLVHDEVEVDDGGPEPLPGRLGHSRAAVSASLSSRVYLLGFNWRPFVEPAVGWHRRLHREVEHLRVTSEGTQDYGIDVDPFHRDSLMLSFSLGLEHVWDRIAMGMRIEGSAILDVEPVWQGGLVVFLSYDFYP